MHFKKNRGRGCTYCWPVIHTNYLMLRPRNAHSCFLEQIRCLCDVTPVCLLYVAAEQSNRAAPTALSPIPASLVLLPHRCLLYWDCPACSCVTNSNTNPAHLSIHIVLFQSTSPFSLLEAQTMFKSLFRFPCSLSDWLLLLLLTAITSVLCIIKIFPI